MNIRENGVGTSKRVKQYAVLLGSIFALTAWLGSLVALENPEEIKKIIVLFAGEVNGLREVGKISLFIYLFGGNTAKAFLSMILGTFLGIVPVLFIAMNGLVLGAIGTVAAGAGGAEALLLGIAPHAIFELPGVILASAYGLLLGGAFWGKIRGRSAMKPAFASAFRAFGTLVIPLLAFAAFIEVFITSALLGSLSSAS